MPLVNLMQKSFTAGEIDEKLDARLDLATYFTGASKIRNALVKPQGSAKRRPGFEFIDDLPVDGEIMFFDFIYSDEDKYLLVLIGGELDTESYTNDTAGKTDFTYTLIIATEDEIEVRVNEEYYSLEQSDIHIATAGQEYFDYTFSANTYADFKVFKNSIEIVYGDFVIDFDTKQIQIAPALAGDEIKILKFEENTYTVDLGINTVIFTLGLEIGDIVKFTKKTGSMRVYKNDLLQTTILNTVQNYQVPDITYAQSYDTLLLFHKDFHPKAFIRENDTTWYNIDWVLLNIPTYGFNGSQNHYIRLTDNGGNTNIDFREWLDGSVRAKAYIRRTTVSEGASTTVDVPFTTDDIGRFIRTPDGGYAEIEGIETISQGVQAVVRILYKFRNNYDALNNIETTEYQPYEWRFEERVWGLTNNAHPDRKWPACGAFYQGRLWMASTYDRPSTWWGSVVNDENNFEDYIPKFADYGINVTVGGGLQSEFHRLIAGQHLYGLADTGEYYIPVSNTEPITPENVSIRRNSSYGSENLPVFEIDGNIFFVREGGKSLIESIYDFASGRYINSDLSLLSPELIKSPVSMSYRKQTSTSESDFLLIVNGDGTLIVLCTLSAQKVTAFTVCETDGKITMSGVSDFNMYFAVERKINGSSVRYLEKFNEDLLLDSGVYKKEPVDEFTALLDQTDFIYTFIISNYTEIRLKRDGKIIPYLSDIEYFEYAAALQTEFFYTFTILNNEDIAVYKDSVLLILTTDYTVDILLNKVTLVVPANENDKIEIIKKNYKVDIGTTTVTLIEAAYENEKIILEKVFTEVTGLSHLIGETVKIVLDNTIQPDQVVVSDTITLLREGNEAHVGLAFPIVDEKTGNHVHIESMPIESEGQMGVSVGRKKRINEITLKVNKTSHAILNKNKATIKRIGIDNLDTPTPEVTGNIQVKGVLGWDDIVRVSVGQQLPLPFELLGMAYKVRF